MGKTSARRGKNKLKALINSIQPPRVGEVNLYGLAAGLNEHSQLAITLLIRNGNLHDMTLDSLPLAVEDASGKIVAIGQFHLKQAKLKAFSSKPWTFVFPKEMLTTTEIDLSRWKAYPPQNQTISHS